MKSNTTISHLLYYICHFSNIIVTIIRFLKNKAKTLCHIFILTFNKLGLQLKIPKKDVKTFLHQNSSSPFAYAFCSSF